MRTHSLKAARILMMKKAVSLLTVWAMLLGIFTPMTVSAEEPEDQPIDGGFAVNLKWNGYVVDSQNYVYDSNTNETREIRLKVSYRNDRLLNTDNRGQIIITVPGINDAGRDIHTKEKQRQATQLHIHNPEKWINTHYVPTAKHWLVSSFIIQHHRRNIIYRLFSAHQENQEVR